MALDNDCKLVCTTDKKIAGVVNLPFAEGDYDDTKETVKQTIAETHKSKRIGDSITVSMKIG